MKKTNLIRTFLVLIIFAFHSIALQAQENEDIPANVIQNQKCFKCHGGKFYSFYNESQGKVVKERMNPYFVFDSATFYTSNHKSFVCTDCHSGDYKNFPHDGNLRMEAKAVCLDCHGGDDTYAQYNFEGIEAEFQKSVHSSRHDESFTCWMCHNPHTYKINARNTSNLSQTIAYDNAICLNCHANINNYQMLTEKENPNVLVTHDWLPNQKAHFSSVRCVECHTHNNDSILVAHLILPKEQAVKKCVQCHQSNSILMASLYKYQVQERRNKAGFFNASLMSDSYVIGANRNLYLNIISLVIFGFVIMGIVIHSIIRIIKK